MSVHNGFTWETDLEWNSWSLDKIETNGSNTGIRLSDLPDGGYQTSGEATYKFSPGGNNKWIKATLDTDDPIETAKKYIWASVFNKNSVSQINPDDGTVVKEWDVGNNPSRTTIGCNNDAWVANRGYADMSLIPSISHIIPSEDRVITHRLPSNLKVPRSISIDCSSNPDYLWVGANGKLIKLSTTAFDALGDDPNVVASGEDGAQVDVTVDISPGEPYATYGSVFGLNSDYLYVASWNYNGYVVDYTAINKIGTSDHTLMGGNFPVSAGRYIIGNDWLGNVWRDGKCFRTAADGTTKELCSGGGVGLIVLPEASGKIAYSKRFGSKLELCVGDLVDNKTANPSIANTSCTSDDSLGGNDIFDVAITGGGMGYDDDYDIWYLPRKGNFISEFKQSENYSVGHRYSPTAKAGGGVYSYSDFLGNALDNSTKAGISPKYSTDGVTFFSVNADGSFPDQIEPSADLYIKVGMSGSGTNSPLLRSLKIEYDPESFSNLRILRTTHTSSLSRDIADEESTFERGEVVYVRVKLFEPERARDSVAFTDRFSNVSITKPPRNFRFKSGCSGAGDLITPNPKDISENQVSFNINLPLGLSCIDYEYTAN